MIKAVILIIIAELWNAAGHVLFTKGTNTLPDMPRVTVEGTMRFFRAVIRQRFIWVGMITLTIGLLIWIMALAHADLSYVYPIGSFQYVVILVAARIFLNEKIDWMKLIGTLLVVIGIIVIAVS
ncbi:MAG: EamA family transporter [Candidatus Omnitrophica bacterium]|nr:EamA family transporter [Candidatus Omnitrophota bacterium]